MKMSWLGRWWADVADLLFPRLCGACDGVLGRGEEALCTECRWDLPLTYYWLSEQNYAVDVLAGRFAFRNACSLMFFESGENRYRRMIHRMKYGSRIDLASSLGALLGSMMADSPLYKDVDLVVPVPLHWSKRLRRGYNQSEELAAGIASELGVDHEFRALRRIRRTAVQAHKKNRHERWANVAGAFRVTNIDRLNGRHVLLVDDVLTTGATIEACARAIIEQSPTTTISIATLAVVRKHVHRA